MPISAQPIALFSQAAGTLSTDRHRRNQHGLAQSGFQEDVAVNRAGADAAVASDAYQQAQVLMAKGVDQETAWSQVKNSSPELFAGLASNPRAIEGANKLRLSALGKDDDRRFMGYEQEVDPATGEPTGQLIRKYANAKTKTVGPETRNQTGDDDDEVVRIGSGAAFEELVRGAMASAGKHGHSFGEGAVSAAGEVNRAHTSQSRQEEERRYQDLLALGEANNEAAEQPPVQEGRMHNAQGEGAPIQTPVLPDYNQMASEKLIDGTANQATEGFTNQLRVIDTRVAGLSKALESAQNDPRFPGGEEARTQAVSEMTTEVERLKTERYRVNRKQLGVGEPTFDPDVPMLDRMESQRALGRAGTSDKARRDNAAAYTASLKGVENLPLETQKQVVEAGAGVIGTTRTAEQIRASARMLSRVQHTAAERTPSQLRTALYLHSLNQLSTPGLESFISGQAVKEPPAQADNFQLTRDGRVFNKATGVISDPEGLSTKEILGNAKDNDAFNQTVAGQALSAGYAGQYAGMDGDQREAAHAGIIGIAMQGRQLFMNMLETNDRALIDISNPQISQDIRTMLLTIASDVYMDQLQKGAESRWPWQKPKDVMSHVSQHPMFADVIEELREQGVDIRN